MTSLKRKKSIFDLDKPLYLKKQTHGNFTESRCKNKLCGKDKTIVETDSGFLVCCVCGFQQGFVGYKQFIPSRESTSESLSLVHWSLEGDHFKSEEDEILSKHLNRFKEYLRTTYLSTRSVKSSTYDVNLNVVVSKWKQFISSNSKLLPLRKKRNEYYNSMVYFIHFLEKDTDGMDNIRTINFKKKSKDGKDIAVTNKTFQYMNANIDSFPSLPQISSLYATKWIECITFEGEDGRTILNEKILKILNTPGIFSYRSCVKNMAAGCIWLVYERYRSKPSLFFISNGIDPNLTQSKLSIITGCTVSTIATTSRNIEDKYEELFKESRLNPPVKPSLPLQPRE